MKILDAESIRRLDQFTIENEPISSVELMERASQVFANWLIPQLNREQLIHVYCGVGNNGGDGLAVSRMLAAQDLKVQPFLFRISNQLSQDNQINLNRLEEAGLKVIEFKTVAELANNSEPNIVIDALWGSGLSRPLEGEAAKLVEFLNTLNTRRIALDIPSGLKIDGAMEGAIFRADKTLSFELPKLAFLLPEYEEFVGDWHFRSIGLSPAAIDQAATNFYFSELDEMLQIIRFRKRFSHKGSNGHSLIAAGSKGKMGAAILAASACLQVGSGLTSLHIPNLSADSIHARQPELMISFDLHEECLSALPDLSPYDQIACGPGIGLSHETKGFVLQLLESARPLILDADALNLISQNPDWMDIIPKASILTPHPKEFERLFGKSDNSFERLAKLRKAAQQLACIIILKGAFSAVADPSGNVYFNSTGNPALATAGSGDVLTGIITGLRAQGYNSLEAARLGVFIHGFAADLHQAHCTSERMLASDIVAYLPQAIAYLVQTKKQRQND